MQLPTVSVAFDDPEAFAQYVGEMQRHVNYDLMARLTAALETCDDPREHAMLTAALNALAKPAEKGQGRP